MELIDIVRQAQGGSAITNMARAFNIAPGQAEAALKAVMPELARGIERNTLSRGGVADLIAALGDRRKLENLNNPAMFGNANVQADGNAILGHILGTKDASRGVAQRAALSSGVGEGLIKMLLPYIAQMLMGALANKTQGGLGDILSKIPGMPGAQGNSGGMGGGAPSFPQSRQQPFPQPSMPAPRQMPDRNDNPFGNGDVRGGGNGPFGGGGPLPLPTNLPSESSSGGAGSNPYGDLSDIIRSGGGAAGGAAAGGGALWSIIRTMLGGALGFSTKGGVMGWIFRAIILRYGMSIVRAIFGGILGRR